MRLSFRPTAADTGPETCCQAACCTTHSLTESGLRAIFERRHRWRHKRGLLFDRSFSDDDGGIPE